MHSSLIMKIKCLSLFAVFLLTSGFGYAGSITNTLAICMPAKKIPSDSLLHGSVRPERLALAPEPLLCDKDFVSYDPTNHEFAVTAAATKRLAERLAITGAPTTLASGVAVYHLQWDDTPVVILASGDAVYLGILSTPVSSTSFFYSLPVITPRLPCIEATDTNAVLFHIEVMAERGRPWTDPRRDPRILAALRTLGLTH